MTEMTQEKFDKLLDVNQVCYILDMSAPLYSLMKGQGKVPKEVHRRGRKFYYDPKDIEQYIIEQRLGAEAKSKQRFARFAEVGKTKVQ